MIIFESNALNLMHHNFSAYFVVNPECISYLLNMQGHFLIFLDFLFVYIDIYLHHVIDEFIIIFTLCH